MVARELKAGVLPVLSVAAADYLNGERTAEEMSALSPDWQDVVDLYGAQDAYAAAVQALAPVGYWRFGEAAGTTVADEAGAADLTLSGVTLGVPGALGGSDDTAADFTSGDAAASVAAPFSFVSGDPFSIVLFFRWAGAPNGAGDKSYHTLFKGFAGNGNSRILLYSDGWQALRFFIVDGAGVTQTHLISSTIGFNNAAWHMLAYTYDGTTLRAYYDGAPVGSNLAVSGYTVGASDLRFGNDSSGVYQANGDFDEVAVFDSTLSAQDIVDLWTLAAVA